MSSEIDQFEVEDDDFSGFSIEIPNQSYCWNKGKCKDFHGKLTANGEVFDMYGLTAAHKTLPLNTIIRVTNKANDNSLKLRVNDRGPYVGNRILDCSYGAALKLDFLNQGTTEIKIEVIEWGDDKYMKHK